MMLENHSTTGSHLLCLSDNETAILLGYTIIQQNNYKTMSVKHCETIYKAYETYTV